MSQKEKEAKTREKKMRKMESNQRQEREKINKILNASAVTIVHKCTILHPLMWVFFLV